MLAIEESTTVRDLLKVHPNAFQVLVSHGMCEDCRADPPPVPLGQFARKHCGGNISGLIDELNQTISG